MEECDKKGPNVSKRFEASEQIPGLPTDNISRPPDEKQLLLAPGLEGKKVKSKT